jgi:hypothetical protein
MRHRPLAAAGVALASLASLAAAGCAEDRSSWGSADGDGPAGGADTGAPCTSLRARIDSDVIAGPLPFSAQLGFTAECSAGALTEVRWDLGDGETSDEEAPSHTWLASGSFEVQLQLADASGARATATRSFEVWPASCPTLEASTQVGTLQEPELDEASGLVESRTQPGLLWTHNDSGDGPRVFAMDPDGTPRGSFRLDGAPDGDWEDIAIGADPATGAPLLYVGDIGSNGTERSTLVVYLVPEPTVGDSAEEQLLSDWGQLDLAFPTGAALNADTLMVDPVTEDLYVVAGEADGTSGVYRAAAPHRAGATTTLERIAVLAFGGADLPGSAVPTGGEFSPLGDQVSIRTTDSAFLWLRDQAVDLADAFAGAACPLALPSEVRGESLAYSADGLRLLTTSEELYQPIWSTPFAPPEPPCAAGEARILSSDSSATIPHEPVFSIDPRCLPAGLDGVVWDFGDGSPSSTEPTPSHLYLASGSYTVTAEVVDLDGAIAQGSLLLEVEPASCPTPGTSESWGTVETDALVELSGVAHSARNPGVLWAHNDSGHDSVLYAMAEDGRALGTWRLDVSSRDWEDMDLAWDEVLGAPAIYIGDIGDNAESREDLTVLIAAEPTVDLDADAADHALEGQHSLTLRYPDGAHNAESLLIDPVTGDLYVVTKDAGGPAHVFHKPAPHEDGSTTELVEIASLLFGEAPLEGSGATTAADWSPLGDQIAIRTYSAAWLWRRDQAESVAAAFAGTPCDLDAPTENQGEALSFTADGSGYVVVSEGSHPAIHHTPLE